MVLWLQAIGIVCFSLYTRHSVAHSLLEGGIIAGTALVAGCPLRSRTLQASVAAFGLIASSAVLVHLSGGFIEFHFHFFVMVGLLALYQEWAPFLLAIGFVLLHHGVVGVLDPSAVYNHPAAIAHPWQWAAIHAAFIAAMSAVSLLTWRVNETTYALAQLLLDSAGEGVVGLDLERRVTFVNDVAVKLFEWNPRQVSGEPIHALLTPVDEGEPGLSAIREHGTISATGQGTFRRRDGTKVPLEYVSTPITERGRVVGAVLVLKDVTERQRLFQESEQRRRAAEGLAARMKRLTQLSHLVAASLDVQHVLDSVTEAAQDLLTADLVRLWIVDEEAGVLRLAAQTVHPELGSVPMSAEFPLGQGVVGWVVAHKTKRFVRNLRDDALFSNKHWAHAAGLQSLVAVPLISSERAVGALMVLTKTLRELTLEEGELLDLFADNAATALEHARLYRGAQRAYEELAQTQAQLVRGATLRAVGELAAGAAHHLNNLLAVVVGRLDLALSKFKAPEIQYQLLPAQQAARDGADVVRRLTGFSRRHPEGTLVSADLNQLAEEALELTRPRWQNEAAVGGIRIEASLASGAVPQVAADLPSIREVFVNLILNAVDAMPRGGHIVIKTWAADHRVYCAVSDTGPGMSAEIQRRVLEPFFTTKGVKSTGLGLSVSYGIIQRHGGELMIDSAEGQGTTVTFWLPVAHPQAADTPGDTTVTVIPALRILLIDDDAPVRQVVADLLGREGHEVVQAGDGAEGLARLSDGPRADLVLTDLGMPGLTGWEVASAIKASHPSLPVGLVTGWGEAPRVEAGERAAVDFILPKPIAPAAFRAAIARLRLEPEAR